MTYEDINQIIGIDDDNQQVSKMIEVNTLDTFVQLFVAGITDAQADEFTASLEQSMGSVAPDSNIGIYYQVLNHVYGGAPLTTSDAKNFITSVLPIQVNVLAGKDVTISKDTTIGPADHPYFINADTLTIDGGSLTLITTALTVRANKLVVTGKSGSKKSYHIGVFGQQGDDGKPGSDGQPYSEAAKNGKNASVPTAGICTGASNGGTGGPGKVGTTGHNGNKGEVGIASSPANLMIDNYSEDSGEFIIFTQSGGGGTGGKGGGGGAGQAGGNGGKGCKSGCEGTNGGDGGDGGDGGTGGNGGDGGDGVDGNPIIITFPNDFKDSVKAITKIAPAGDGGDGGERGKGGKGGAGGGGGKHAHSGSSGGAGGFGKDGKKGNSGQNVGNPADVIYHFV